MLHLIVGNSNHYFYSSLLSVKYEIICINQSLKYVCLKKNFQMKIENIFT